MKSKDLFFFIFSDIDSNTIFAVTFFAIVVVLSSLAAILVYYKRRTRSPSSRDVHQGMCILFYVVFYFSFIYFFYICLSFFLFNFSFVFQ